MCIKYKGKKMYTKFLILTTIMVIFISGCAQPQPKAYPLRKKGIVLQDRYNKKFYYVPSNASGSSLTAKWAKLNNVTSSGLLYCRKNDAWVLVNQLNPQDNKLMMNYINTLTPAEKQQLEKDPNIIPKMNSKEFQALKQFETEVARKGYATCLKPLSNSQVKQYKAYVRQQQKINNDPRVVAARVQANAINNAALTQQTTAIQQQKSMERMYNQQMMQNAIYNNNQMLQWQNNQFWQMNNQIQNNTAAWWRYTH